ncbi:MAG: hypothetical protein ACREOZ_01710, partial [Gloeomargaritales cyanobacterium]
MATTEGEVILLRANHAILGITGNSLLSSGQIEDYEHRIDTRPRTRGGKQRLYLRDGYTVPLFHSGPHMYVRCRYPTEEEIKDENIPVVELTSPAGWNPSEVENDNTISDDDNVDEMMLAVAKTERHEPDWEKYRRCLGFKPLDVVKATLAATTQYARNVLARLPQREHYKPRFRGLNCSRLHETVATDTLHSSIRAIGGERCAQLYVGKTSCFTQLYGMQSENQMPSTFQDFVRQWG